MSESKFGWMGKSLGSKAYKEKTDFRLGRSRGRRCARPFVKLFDKGLKKKRTSCWKKRERNEMEMQYSAIRGRVHIYCLKRKSQYFKGWVLFLGKYLLCLGLPQWNLTWTIDEGNNFHLGHPDMAKLNGENIVIFCPMDCQNDDGMSDTLMSSLEYKIQIMGTSLFLKFSNIIWRIWL